MFQRERQRRANSQADVPDTGLRWRRTRYNEDGWIQRERGREGRTEKGEKEYPPYGLGCGQQRQTSEVNCHVSCLCIPFQLTPSLSVSLPLSLSLTLVCAVNESLREYLCAICLMPQLNINLAGWQTGLGVQMVAIQPICISSTSMYTSLNILYVYAFFIQYRIQLICTLKSIYSPYLEWVYTLSRQARLHTTCYTVSIHDIYRVGIHFVTILSLTWC